MYSTRTDHNIHRLSLIVTFVLTFLLCEAQANVNAKTSISGKVNILNVDTCKPAHICEIVTNVSRAAWNVAIPKIRGLPIIHNDILVVAANHGAIALNRKTGKILWSKDTLAPDADPNVSGNNVKRFQMFSPVVVSDILLLATSEELTGHVFGLDLHTGAVKWSYVSAKTFATEETRGRILNRPIIWGNKAIFRTGRGLTALRTSDGTELWNRAFDPNGMVPVAVSGLPASDSHAIYFNSDFGVAYAIDPTDGHIIWSRQTAGLDIQRVANVSKISMTFTACHPLRIHDKLIVTDGVGNIYAKRATDGSSLWQTKSGLAFQLLSAGNRIYAGTENGFIEIDETSGKIVREHHVAKGVIGFAIKGDNAYLGAVPKGWESFSLSQWKTREKFDTFHVSTLTIHLNRLYLSGYTGQSRETGELRAYDLDAKH